MYAVGCTTDSKLLMAIAFKRMSIFKEKPKHKTQQRDKGKNPDFPHCFLFLNAIPKRE